MQISRESNQSSVGPRSRSEEHTSELQSRGHLVCRLLLEKKNEDDALQRTRQVYLSLGTELTAHDADQRARRVYLGFCAGLAVYGRGRAFRFFFFNDTATTEIYTLSLHDALPISRRRREQRGPVAREPGHRRRLRR